MVAALSGLCAAWASGSPAGSGSVDAMLLFGTGALVAWASASAGWRVLLGVSAVVLVCSTSSLWLLLLATAALGASSWLATHRASAPVRRAAIGAAVAQVALRLPLQGFFSLSALVAGLVMIALVVAGVARRQRHVRRRVMWATAGCVGFCVVAAAGLGAAVLSARSSASKGYRSLLEALDRAGSGDTASAAASFERAASELAEAHRSLQSPWTLPARVVPVLAQNWRAGDVLLGGASAASVAAHSALSVVDLDQLRVVNGTIDVNAVAVLAEPLGRLETAVTALQVDIVRADSAWLLSGLQTRLDTARQRVDKVSVQAHGSATAARLAPDLLGAAGERRYLLAFTSPAEMRGQSGLMGNWAEVTVRRGRLELAEHGRTNELVVGLAQHPALYLDSLSPNFLRRYGPFGAGGATEPVKPKYWSNVTMSPDMPAVGSQMAQMFERATGRRVDGVFVLDPHAVAALVALTGPIDLPDAGVTLTAANTEDLLLRGQYDRPEADREALLDEAITTTIDRMLQSELPGPQVIAAKLGPSAQGGHLSAWARRDAEEGLLQTVGMDAALPELLGADGLAVSLDNAAGNKIDTFHRLKVTYRSVVNERSGAVDAVVTVELRNTAPAAGLPDYVISNLVGLPKGSSRTLVNIYTPLAFVSATLNDDSVGLSTGEERQWSAYSRAIEVAAGQTATLVVHLRGAVGPGTYRLVVRPQPLAEATEWDIESDVRDGADVQFQGVLDRRSVLSVRGVDAYRAVATTTP